VALDMVYDRRRPATDTEPAYDPLQRFLELFEGVTTADARAERAAELLTLPVGERLQRRIIDGEGKGLSDDLDAALAAGTPAMEIINTDLLAGMRVVGELFGSGQMQLPFVLQSAEVMKTAVAYLEPHLEKTDARGKGTIVLATVKGDCARHRQEPGRHHLDQQRIHRGESGHQAADRCDHRRRRGAPR
jgi:5-methyltetrahydrofolate--homocysteine methyltransferase